MQVGRSHLSLMAESRPYQRSEKGQQALFEWGFRSSYFQLASVLLALSSSACYQTEQDVEVLFAGLKIPYAQELYVQELYAPEDV